jgi:hypothetical protein
MRDPRTSTDGINHAIHVIRGQRVILDEDLARLYGVPTGRLNEAVKRISLRFPQDFAFRLSASEAHDLKSQIAISSSHGGRRRSEPMAFTEQGVAMLSSVLSSRRAVAVNIEIMRAFVKMRQAIAVNAELAKRLSAVEAGLEQQRAEFGLHATQTAQALAEHEQLIHEVFATIHRLIAEEDDPAAYPRVGFTLGDPDE